MRLLQQARAALERLQQLSFITWRFPVASLAWCFGPDEAWHWSNLLHLRLHLGIWPEHSPTGFFDNAGLFIRLDGPFALYWQIRWAGATASRALWQAGIGWKEHGQFGAIFRIQSDASAKAGVTFPNPWEASGWKDGPH